MEVLSTARLDLKPVSDEDNHILYRWRLDEAYLKMVATRRSIVSFEKFLAEQRRAFDTNRHMQCIININDTARTPVGTLFTFDFNLTDGHVFLNTYIDEKYRGKGYGPEASIILVCYLFDFYPLHKIYFEAFGHNDPSLSMIRTAGMVEEGVFKEHRYFNGQRYDVIRFAAYRNRLERIRALDRKFKERRNPKGNS